MSKFELASLIRNFLSNNDDAEHATCLDADIILTTKDKEFLIRVEEISRVEL